MFEEFLANLEKAFDACGDSALLACCSGGVDSMVLLDLLERARLEKHFRLGVMHVDHGLRGAAALHDAAFVEDVCRRKNIVCHLARLGLAAGSANLEEKARLGRYAAIRACLARNAYDYAVTGHNLDDQAETLLYRLARGSGPRGLGGMLPENDRIIRPLLPFTRSQIERYASENGVDYVNDETNTERRYARNLIRHDLMPVLRAINPGCNQALARFARHAAIENDYLEQAASRLRESAMINDWRVARIFDQQVLEDAHPALVRRLLINEAAGMLDEHRGIDARQVDQLMKVISGTHRAHVIRRRLRVAADHGRLALLSATNVPCYRLAVDHPGSYCLEGIGRTVRVAGPFQESLIIRPAVAGDRLAGRKLNRLLAGLGVDAFLRPYWPVLARKEEVVAVAGILNDDRYLLELDEDV